MAIIFKGQESTKNVDGKDINVIPFAGTDKDEEMSSMGVGLLIHSDASTSRLWGLGMPHDIVASYRGMKIAEQVPTFGSGTLNACWEAGHNKVHSSDKESVNKIESMIGVDKRQQILQAPLPSFDDAIKLMQERNIGFDVYFFLREIEQGNLRITPVLEQVINDYSDKVLVSRGLAGDYKKAHQALTKKPKGLFARLRGRKISSESMDCAKAYVDMAEQMFPTLIPDLKQQYSLLNQNMVYGIDLSQFSKRPDSSAAQAIDEIYDNRKRFSQAAADLRPAFARTLSPEQKFIAYHTALENMVEAASDISKGYSTLEIHIRKKDACSATKSLADEIVKMINRAVRENMKDAYTLK